MSRGTTRPVRRRKERRHPSIFFFIVLALGLLFLFWLFAHSIRQPPQKLGQAGVDLRPKILTADLGPVLPEPSVRKGFVGMSAIGMPIDLLRRS